jgi:hypothetical protein
MREVPDKKGRPGLGDYATFTRGGSFALLSELTGLKERPIDVEPGQRCIVVKAGHPRYREKKKIWVYVRLVDADGNSNGMIEAPLWWLRPRSILDDLAEA